MSWRKVKLGDVCRAINTGPFGSQLHQYDYSIQGIPVVMPKDIINGRISESSIARVSDEHVIRLGRHRVALGDLLFSRRGDVGRCALVGVREEGWLCGTGCLRVQIDEERASPDFVFRSMCQEDSVKWLEGHAVGATMPNINPGILSGVPLSLPPLPIQQKIADVLGAYDDLIENNRKRIALLEKMARELYRERFVRRRGKGGFVGLLDLFDFVRGKSYASYEIDVEEGVPMVNLKNIQAWGGYKNGAERLYSGDYKPEQTLQRGDVVMGVTDMTQDRRLVGHVAMIPTVGTVATFSMDIIKLLPNNISSVELYSILNYSGVSKEISQLATGATVLHLRPSSLTSIKAWVPDLGEFEKVEVLFKSYYDEIDNLQLQSNNLAHQRDRLLPRLMSGKIDVEKLVKEGKEGK